MQCAVCAHDVLLDHDGDGTDADPYRCARCSCAFVMEDGHPLVILVDED